MCIITTVQCTSALHWAGKVLLINYSTACYSYLWTYDLYGPVVMLLMRATPLRGQVGGGWNLEIETFLGYVKWHRVIRRVPFEAQ
jgi:hypothetical protein